VKVHQDLGQRDLKVEHHSTRVQVFHLVEHAAMARCELHKRSDILCGREKADMHPRLAYLFDLRHVWELCRVIDLNDLTAGQEHFVLYARRCGQQVDLVLTLQTLLNDLHVQEPQEATTKAHV